MSNLDCIKWPKMSILWWGERGWLFEDFYVDEKVEVSEKNVHFIYWRELVA